MAADQAPEPAMAAGDDPRAFAAVLHAVYDARMSGDRAPARPRAVIGDSWDRVQQAGVDPDSGTPTPTLDRTQLAFRRSESGLGEVLDAVMHHLDTLIADGDNVLVVADANGQVLWRDGHPQVLCRADRLGFAEGASWAETAVGTNAIGTALASGRAVQVFSAEHFVRSHHAWTCAGAPIHDPRTGGVLGVVDVSGPAATIHPTTLALVDTVAKLAESQLRERHRSRLDTLRTVAAPMLARSSGPVLAVDGFGWVAAVDGVSPRERLPLPQACPPGRLYLHGLGDCDLEPLPGGWLVRVTAPDDGRTRQVLLEIPGEQAADPLVRVSGADGSWVHRPSPRHAQLLRLLARNPGGMTAAELAVALFGDAARTVTVRAEISRLRKRFGALLLAEPYRLAATVVPVVDGTPAP
ncbi:GAF domain-containing protein [Gordonia sp. VNK21]|uniref:helix-turn-helix domain-containing protein n=1 Tax=Gordonia sp. VNK21 TaxID=3382483 RepID=UPI0038D4AD49